jgi:hypothetical protein
LTQWRERAASRKRAEARADREDDETGAEGRPWNWETFWREVESRLAASVDGRIAFYETRIAALERQIRELEERR